MRLASAVAIASIVTGAYSFIIARAAKAIRGVISTVQADVDGLDSAIKDWTTDPEPILDASNKLSAAIKDSSVTVKSSQSLSLNDAVTLLGPVEKLTAHVKTLLDDLKGKKDLIQKNGFCDVACTQIGKGKTES